MESRTKRAQEMDRVVLERFPRLADHPSKPRPPTYTQRRLYRSILPLFLLEKQDCYLAFVGNLNGAGTCVIADLSALWCVAWITGKLGKEDVEWEVDYLNAFMRKRWGDKGKEAPVSTFEWGSVRFSGFGEYLTLTGIIVEERDASRGRFRDPEFEPAQTVVTARVSWNNGEVDVEDAI